MVEDESKIYKISVTAKELRYFISCGSALLQNIPKGSLSTYCDLNKEEIIEVSDRLREFADENGIDM